MLFDTLTTFIHTLSNSSYNACVESVIWLYYLQWHSRSMCMFALIHTHIYGYTLVCANCKCLSLHTHSMQLIVQLTQCYTYALVLNHFCVYQKLHYTYSEFSKWMHYIYIYTHLHHNTSHEYAKFLCIPFVSDHHFMCRLCKTYVHSALTHMMYSMSVSAVVHLWCTHNIIHLH